MTRRADEEAHQRRRGHGPREPRRPGRRAPRPGQGRPARRVVLPGRRPDAGQGRARLRRRFRPRAAPAGTWAGMLDAACPGEVSTSPVPDQVEAATRAMDGGAGVLHMVKNYTGDVLNFEMAAALVAGDIEMVSVIADDDVAVEDSLYTAGRRGVGATVLVEKIAGAAAEAGAFAGDVAAVARRVNEEGRSMGLALTSCVVPAAGTPTFDLPADEVEVGIGIHGEPGRRREQRRPSTTWPSGSWRRSCRTSGWRAGERPRVRQRDGRDAPHRAVRRVPQRAKVLAGLGMSSAAASSATTSRASRWPASRSRSCGSTMSSSGSGMRPSTPPALRWGR